MHDFTLTQYKAFMDALLKWHGEWRAIHDVDRFPERSLPIAEMEAAMGVRSTYYFRSMHFSSHEGVIRAIADLGHEVGYHYECLTTCGGDVESAYRDFCLNLERLRRIAPVHTACAHGSPRSPYNSQDIWKQYDIHSLGIDYEPMLDTDFSRTLYLTDTGRRWDGYRVSVRDKVPGWQERWDAEGLSFHSTDDIIHALRDLGHPIHGKALLINTHPQRWLPAGAAWVAEAVAQWGKNIAKRVLVAAKNRSL